MNQEELIMSGERIKLDLKDKKIIEVLQKNARETTTSIEKKTGIPRDSVKYRINRLKKYGIILSFHTRINPAKLGYPMYVAMGITLYNLSEEREKQLKNFLVNHPKIVYVAKMSGKWDYFIGVCCKDFKELDFVTREIRKKFSKEIKEYDVSTVIEEYKYQYMSGLI